MKPGGIEDETNSGRLERGRESATGRAFIDQVIVPWQGALPKEPHRVLDICTGPGLEAVALKSLGWTPVVVDLSLSVLTTSLVADRALADAAALPFPAAQFAGVLMKDAWVFLSPEEKALAMEGLSRTLVPGGSAVIASQRSDALRIYSVPGGSQFPIRETFLTEEGWQERLAHEQHQGRVFNLEFVSLPDPTIELARRNGLTPMALLNYSVESPLAADNRWLAASGFVITLQK